MRALVTGAGGFVGSHLMRALVARGDDVVALVRGEAGLRGVESAGARGVRGSVEDAAAVERAAAGCEVLFHLAAVCQRSSRDERAHRAAHVEGTRLLAEAALRHGARRFVLCSTASVHGAVAGVAPDETAPLRPGDVYQRTKAEGEAVLREVAARGLDAVVLRPVAVYGPGDRRLLKLFRLALARPSLIVGPGRARHQMIHVEDVVAALLLSADHPAAAGRTFLLGAETTTLEELYARIAVAAGRPATAPWKLPAAPLRALARAVATAAAAMGADPPLDPRRVDFFVEDRFARVEAARDVLGFEPRVGLDAGLAATLAWYRREGLLAPG